MTFKKAIHWTLTFGVLSAFTVYTAQNIGGRAVERAYAKTIDANPAFAQMSHFVVVEPDEIRRRAIGRVIDRFSRKAEREKELCSLTSAQQQLLSTRYDLDTKAVRVRGRTVSVGGAGEGVHGIGRQELERLLGDQAPNVHCKKFEVFEQVLLLLSAHLS